MKFSIITPTLLRPSLMTCCESIEQQSHLDWEHIIFVDRDLGDDPNVDINPLPNRFLITNAIRHGNFGNTPRHLAWRFATGDYVLYLDDDNRLAHPDALYDISCALESTSLPKWTVFPILRFGSPFFTDDPRSCHTDTANMVISRPIAQWPDGPEYTMDGIFCDHLKANYPYASFGHYKPIVIMDSMGKGELA